jgi:hypothetical protein
VAIQSLNSIRASFAPNFRPIRHAYFIQKDNFESFTLAVRLSGTQWGGMRNLIIPINEDTGLEQSVDKHLLTLHEPDRFVDFASTGRRGDSTLGTLLAKQLREMFPYRVDLVHWLKPETDDHSLHAYSHIYGRDLSEPDVVRTGETLRVYKWDETSELHPILLATFGQIYPGQEQSYRDIFVTKHLDISSTLENFWEYQYHRDNGSSILNLTSQLLKMRTVIGHGFERAVCQALCKRFLGPSRQRLSGTSALC